MALVAAVALGCAGARPSPPPHPGLAGRIADGHVPSPVPPEALPARGGPPLHAGGGRAQLGYTVGAMLGLALAVAVAVLASRTKPGQNPHPARPAQGGGQERLDPRNH